MARAGPFRGTWPAMQLPFTEDRSIDMGEFARLARWLAERVEFRAWLPVAKPGRSWARGR